MQNQKNFTKREIEYAEKKMNQTVYQTGGVTVTVNKRKIFYLVFGFLILYTLVQIWSINSGHEEVGGLGNFFVPLIFVLSFFLVLAHNRVLKYFLLAVLLPVCFIALFILGLAGSDW